MIIRSISLIHTVLNFIYNKLSYEIFVLVPFFFIGSHVFFNIVFPQSYNYILIRCIESNIFLK